MIRGRVDGQLGKVLVHRPHAARHAVPRGDGFGNLVDLGLQLHARHIDAVEPVQEAARGAEAGANVNDARAGLELDRLGRGVQRRVAEIVHAVKGGRVGELPLRLALEGIQAVAGTLQPVEGHVGDIELLIGGSGCRRIGAIDGRGGHDDVGLDGLVRGGIVDRIKMG